MKLNNLTPLRRLLLALCLLLPPVAMLQAQPMQRPGVPARQHQPARQRGQRATFDREKFRQDITTYIAREASLTHAEAKAFFPVFFEWKEKARDLQHKRDRALRQAAKGAASEKDCLRALKQVKEFDKQMQRLNEHYTDRLVQLVGARKCVKAINAEHHFGRKMFKQMTDKKK